MVKDNTGLSNEQKSHQAILCGRRMRHWPKELQLSVDLKKFPCPDTSMPKLDGQEDGCNKDMQRLVETVTDVETGHNTHAAHYSA